MKDFKKFYKVFEKFKEKTKEENLIVENIKKLIDIKTNDTILDIGSSSGEISSSLQSNIEKITLVDIDETNIPKNFNFIKGEWEKLDIKEKFDIVLASHVWGHFFYTKTQRIAFEKAFNSVKRGGKLVLCYNSNDDIVRDIIIFLRTKKLEAQFDYFDESFLEGLDYVEKKFEVYLDCSDFDELTDYMQVFFVMSDSDFNKTRNLFKSKLKDLLSSPNLIFSQKIVVIKKNKK